MKKVHAHSVAELERNLKTVKVDTAKISHPSSSGGLVYVSPTGLMYGSPSSFMVTSASGLLCASASGLLTV